MKWTKAVICSAMGLVMFCSGCGLQNEHELRPDPDALVLQQSDEVNEAEQVDETKPADDQLPEPEKPGIADLELESEEPEAETEPEEELFEIPDLDEEDDADPPAVTPAPQPAPVETPAPQPAPVQPSATADQQYALNIARGITGSTGITYYNLLDQLVVSGVEYDDAVYAVNNCGVNWTRQASGAASQLRNTFGYTDEEIIDELIFEGYSEEQALAAVGH